MTTIIELQYDEIKVLGYKNEKVSVECVCGGIASGAFSVDESAEGTYTHEFKCFDCGTVLHYTETVGA